MSCCSRAECWPRSCGCVQCRRGSCPCSCVAQTDRRRSKTYLKRSPRSSGGAQNNTTNDRFRSSGGAQNNTLRHSGLLAFAPCPHSLSSLLLSPPCPSAPPSVGLAASSLVVTPSRLSTGTLLIYLWLKPRGVSSRPMDETISGSRLEMTSFDMPFAAYQAWTGRNVINKLQSAALHRPSRCRRGAYGCWVEILWGQGRPDLR